jgi:hypothetical protein
MNNQNMQNNNNVNNNNNNVNEKKEENEKKPNYYTVLENSINHLIDESPDLEITKILMKTKVDIANRVLVTIDEKIDEKANLSLEQNKKNVQQYRTNYFGIVDNRPMCMYWYHGHCRFGEQCMNKHSQ